jgi:hypothetical protein
MSKRRKVKKHLQVNGTKEVEMRECIEHAMTEAQLARFLAANGLWRGGDRILTPQGEVVGIIAQGQNGGCPAILILQESYSLPVQAGDDGCLVTAWWPAFRPAWTLVTGDGQVEIGDLLGPDEVICDLCNAEVSIRPVPMVGSYALCTACFARQGMPFPGTVGPYCVLPARDCERVDDEQRGV